MQREHRALRPTEVRVPDDGSRTFEAVVMTYGVLDDYETIFDAGCFADSLNERLPRITWAHNWAEPLGRYVDFRDSDKELVLIGEFDDFDAVPRARQAYAQLRSGTIDQFSVGFARDKIAEDDDGNTHFVKARLDEAALVLSGAVPGTKLLQVRSGQGLVSVDAVVEIAKKKAAGEIDDAQAKAAVALLTTDEKPSEPDPEAKKAAEDAAAAALAEAQAEADVALAGDQ